MEQVKDIFFFLLLSGQEIPQEQLLNILLILADLSDFEIKPGLSQATQFAINASEAIVKDYDLFIKVYKNELLKMENYELIAFLSL